MNRIQIFTQVGLAGFGFLMAACTSVQKTSIVDAGKGLSASSQSELLHETVPLTPKIQVERFVLDNGLRLLVVEDHSSPTFAYQTWFKVGSRDEKPGLTGLAHLFEHMMFKETKSMKEGEFDRLLEGVGAEGENAFTSRDYTAYIQELPKDSLELIARAEADRMVNLVINEAAFKTEREVVQNERRFRNENNPDGLMDQELFHTAFQHHSYHWPVIGYAEDLNRMSAHDALDFYHTFYSPNHATVIVVGDVVPREVYSIIEKYYGRLPKQTTAQAIIPIEPNQKKPYKKQLKLNIQVEKILMGYRIPGITHEDIPALDVLQNILSGGKSSRLHVALVETGIASSVDAYALDNQDSTLFEVSANLQKKRQTSQAEAVILREFARISKDLVPPLELERAKNRINFHFYSGLESSFEKAYFLGHYETITGDFTRGIEHQKKTQIITPEDVRRVAQRYLKPVNRTIITGVPK